jgi:hypothetical protein
MPLATIGNDTQQVGIALMFILLVRFFVQQSVNPSVESSVVVSSWLILASLLSCANSLLEVCTFSKQGDKAGCICNGQCVTVGGITVYYGGQFGYFVYWGNFGGGPTLCRNNGTQYFAVDSKCPSPVTGFCNYASTAPCCPVAGCSSCTNFSSAACNTPRPTPAPTPSPTLNPTPGPTPGPTNAPPTTSGTSPSTSPTPVTATGGSVASLAATTPASTSQVSFAPQPSQQIVCFGSFLLSHNFQKDDTRDDERWDWQCCNDKGSGHYCSMLFVRFVISYCVKQSCLGILSCVECLSASASNCVWCEPFAGGNNVAFCSDSSASCPTTSVVVLTTCATTTTSSKMICARLNKNGDN